MAGGELAPKRYKAARTSLLRDKKRRFGPNRHQSTLNRKSKRSSTLDGTPTSREDTAEYEYLLVSV